jgi:hypothetical protein
MNALKHVKSFTGPLAFVAYCPFCPSNKAFSITVPRGRPGVGRGHGLASASSARAKVCAHIKAEHAEMIDA